jgi:hypothetical protein
VRKRQRVGSVSRGDHAVAEGGLGHAAAKRRAVHGCYDGLPKGYKGVEQLISFHGQSRVKFHWMRWVEHFVELCGRAEVGSTTRDDDCERPSILVQCRKNSQKSIRDCSIKRVILVWSIVCNSGDAISRLRNQHGRSFVLRLFSSFSDFHCTS